MKNDKTTIHQFSADRPISSRKEDLLGRSGFTESLASAIKGWTGNQLRSGISDETLAQLVIALREDERLCIIHEEEETQEPRIICSLGLIGGLIYGLQNVRG